MKRRILLSTLAACAASAVLAQGVPRKPLRIINAFPAGGVNDLFARLVGDRIGTLLGQAVIVETKAGASGSIGTEVVARAEPDGHTLLLASFPTAVAPALIKTPWDPVKDLVGVAYLGVSPNVITAHPSLGISDLNGLIRLAKSKPGELNYGNPGNGTSLHLAAELFQRTHDIRLTSVAYKGSPPSVPDFLTGRLQLGFYPYSVIGGHINAGKAVAIAVASPSRLKQLPSVATMTEQGFANSQATSWFALMAPAGTPQPIVDALNKAVNAVLADPRTAAAAEGFGGIVVPGWTPQETTAMVQAEVRRWGTFIATAGIKAE